MKKRLFVAFLWFYSAWYGGALLAHFAALPEVVGPLIGLVAGAICLADPGGVIWSPPWRRDRAATASTAASSTARSGVAQPSSGGSPGR